ncbi:MULTISPECIES: XRE family transcriptional regulator [unclassified Mesorhizobium]|uniref:XRE family transcriptional regulator n=1 Tax=unclassified Mesorhizobium TaxID=325217 RepID=UPI00167A8D7A|nr:MULTISPECIES: XRE family transcriptional regulator [unclassified Mesorhizobium]
MAHSGVRETVDNDLPDVTQLVRENLRSIFGHVVANAGLSQTRAAKVCLTDQPTLSKVLSGRNDSVSTDQLLRWLVQLGCRVEISVQCPNGLTFGAIRATLHE